MPRQKNDRHPAEGEIFLLTFSFIGLLRIAQARSREHQFLGLLDQIRRDVVLDLIIDFVEFKPLRLPPFLIDIFTLLSRLQRDEVRYLLQLLSSALEFPVLEPRADRFHWLTFSTGLRIK